MLRSAVAFVLFAAAAGAAAENVETITERRQERGRAVLDRAVEANGGAEALRAINVVRLRLEGQTFPRLQMTTPAPPFEGGSFEETLLFDLENNRLRLDQKASGFGFDADNTIAIADGTGRNYDNRAKTVTPIPAEQATQQQFIQYHRRLPALLLRSALDRTNSLRYLGEDEFEGRRQEVITFVMPDTQQIALYVDAATGLVSKYELLFVDSLEGVEASEIVFGDYRKAGNYQVPGRWSNRQLGEDQTRYTLQAEFNPAAGDDSFRVTGAGYREVKPVPTNLEEAVERRGPAEELRKLDRLEDSLAPYKKAVELAPDLLGWRLGMARARFDLLDYQGADEEVHYVLQRVPPHVIVSPDHPLAATPSRSVSLRELADEPLILLDLPHSREYYLSLFKLLGIAPRIRHRASGYETVRAFVARGHGYSVLNQRLPHDLTYAGGPVVPLPIVEELPPIEVLLVRPVGTRPTLKSRAFEQVCLRVYCVTG